MIPGYKFTLEKDRVVSGPYFVKSVRHVATLNSDFRSGSEPKNEANSTHQYKNEFTCQAEVQPYQPTKTPQRPLIHGFQTATVVGPKDEEVFSDKFGRIKVQFHWDRVGENNADSSCWVRVAQVWAGNRWGAFFWPRVGHEVVVSFENGDPDLPLIVGSVYNAKNMPPMPLPDRLHSSGIKSCSVGGNPIENFSCVIFHDGIGQEYLQMHSETHECLTSETSKLNFSTGMAVNVQGGHSGILGHFGSGSGGGPSDDESSLEPAAQPSIASNEMDSLQQELEQILKTFEMSGSGSGGLLTEVFEFANVHLTGHEATTAAAQAGLGNSAGHLNMITGDSVTSRLGASFEHCFNPNIKITADIEEMLPELAAGMIGLPAEAVLALVWGAGGSLNQVYGNRQTVTYGHDVKIRRGHEILFTEGHFFGSMEGDGRIAKLGSAIRNAANKAIKRLAVIILLGTLAMSIAIKVMLERAPQQKHE